MLLLPPANVVAADVVLDTSQARVAQAVARGESVVVTGAPGTGKSTLVVACAVQAMQVAGRDPSSILVLAATRRGAAELRDQVALRAGQTISAPAVRTADAAAFAILRDSALAVGAPPPRLISGPEQDRILAEILAANYVSLQPLLPPELSPEVLLMRGFRNELRDLIMRATEHEISPAQLAALGEQVPLWRLAAQVYSDYRAVLALRPGGLDVGRQLDPAELVAAGARALATWDIDAPKPKYRLVIVDDYQEATAATAQFITQLAADGAQLVLVGNPDESVQSFRGALPSLVGAASEPKGSGLGTLGLPQFSLVVAWRQTAQLREITNRLAAKLPLLGGSAQQRRAAAATRPAGEPDEADGGSDDVKAGADSDPMAGSAAAVTVAICPSQPQEVAWIARELRREHLLHGTPWRRMAIIARSGSELARLRRELVLAAVPVELLGSDVPLHDEPAVAPLLTILRSTAAGQALTAELVSGLLRSTVGGLDAIALRRLRRALRARELATGGGRASDDLLMEYLADAIKGDTGEPLAGVDDTILAGLQRVARALAAAQAAVQQAEHDITTVLWAIWAATGLADSWRDLALAGGGAGVRADHDLDAVLALFRRAEFFAERNPGAGVDRFVDDLAAQDIAADSIAAQAANTAAISAVTPAGAAGREWDVVAVAGVQDGGWPDLRLRGTMLGAGQLVAVASGQTTNGNDASADADLAVLSARADVLADETRAFLVATSRATRRLLITAVESAELSPSSFLGTVGVAPIYVSDSGGYPLDLRGIIAAARVALLQDGEEADAAAYLLAHLGSAGVSGASPADWYGAASRTSDAPLWQDDDKVRVSPSKVESIAKCPLKWAFEAAGATASAALSQNVGNLIHNIAGDLPAANLAQLRAELERRWPELGMAPGWLETRERANADAMLRRLAAYYQQQGDLQDIHTEVDFRLEVGRTVVAGRADRIEDLGGGKYRIIDFKTGSTLPRHDEMPTNPQLATYQLALNNGAFGDLPAEGNCESAELLFLSQGANGPTTRKQAGLDAAATQLAEQTLIETGEIMAAAKFAAKRNPLCRSCPLKFACPLQATGRQVVA